MLRVQQAVGSSEKCSANYSRRFYSRRFSRLILSCQGFPDIMEIDTSGGSAAHILLIGPEEAEAEAILGEMN
jgi:hypothetical protein